MKVKSIPGFLLSSRLEENLDWKNKGLKPVINARK
jgi:hypothetical protein